MWLQANNEAYLLKDMLITLGFSKPPDSITPFVLFSKVESKVCQTFVAQMQCLHIWSFHLAARICSINLSSSSVVICWNGICGFCVLCHLFCTCVAIAVCFHIQMFLETNGIIFVQQLYSGAYRSRSWLLSVRKRSVAHCWRRVCLKNNGRLSC